jgi:hypothetical protein
MTEYIIALTLPIIAGVLFFGKITKRKRILYLVIVFGYLTMIAGLRGATVGTDTSVYIGYYEIINSFGITQFMAMKGGEYGYVILCAILSAFKCSPQVALFVCALIINTSFAVFIYKYASNICIGSFLYVYCIYYATLNTLRMSVAVAILIWIIPYILSKKPVKALLVLLLAALFHSSAILFLPLLLFSFKNIILTRKRIILFTFISISCAIAWSPILNLVGAIFPKYAKYIGSIAEYENEFSLKRITFYLVFAIVALICMLRMKKRTGITNKNESLGNGLDIKSTSGKLPAIDFYLKYMIFLACYILYVLSLFVAMKFWLGDRISFYLSFSTLIIIPDTIKCVTKNDRGVQIIIYSILFILLFYFGYTMYRGGIAGVYPYKYYWE